MKRSNAVRLHHPACSEPASIIPRARRTCAANPDKPCYNTGRDPPPSHPADLWAITIKRKAVPMSQQQELDAPTYRRRRRDSDLPKPRAGAGGVAQLAARRDGQQPLRIGHARTRLDRISGLARPLRHRREPAARRRVRRGRNRSGAAARKMAGIAKPRSRKLQPPAGWRARPGTTVSPREHDGTRGPALRRPPCRRTQRARRTDARSDHRQPGPTAAAAPAENVSDQPLCGF